eukprot:gene735-909_t
MFNKEKKELQAEGNQHSSNLVGKGTVLEGNLNTVGNLRVEGKIIGSVTTKAKLALGATSFIKGNIIAQNAEVAGEVQGTIEVAGLLTMKATAVVEGDIVISKLIFEEGAKFNGKCRMETTDQRPLPEITALSSLNKKIAPKPVENVTHMLTNMGFAAWLGWKVDKLLKLTNFPLCMFVFALAANLFTLFWFVKKTAHSATHQDKEDELGNKDPV